MSLLFSLIAVLAAPHANDRMFDAPAGSPVEAYDGQALWHLMARCAKGEYEKAESLERAPVTASYEARAKTYGLTAEQMRQREQQTAMTKVERYLTIAMARIAADRQIEIEESRDFLAGQLPQAEAITADFMSDPCVSIANAVQPPAA